MAKYSTDCYSETQLKVLHEGLGKVDDAMEKLHHVSFMKATPEQRTELLSQIDGEAKKQQEIKIPGKDSQAHYFTMMKQLVLLGFFTSKPGATQVLRYIPVPGNYEGCIDYKAGETSWA